jgi:hypothetical protein
MTALTPDGVHRILKRFLPAQNDDFGCDYVEEMHELADFQITMEEQLADLLQRRATEVMEIDRTPMDDFHIRQYSDDLGEQFVANRLRNGFWFSYPALLRIALELEFGERYQGYAGLLKALHRVAAPRRGRHR